MFPVQPVLTQNVEDVTFIDFRESMHNVLKVTSLIFVLKNNMNLNGKRYL
ncbi:MAG: hypothetical protein IKA09_08195 [Lachnospiraceae bacterium]|nr:hypothetical protein [Lachnospiraceae bacterium]